jgi:hypothetical protein
MNLSAGLKLSLPKIEMARNKKCLAVEFAWTRLTGRFTLAQMNDQIIARLRLVDGAERPVFKNLDGRQYVIDDENERVYGV